MNSSFLIKYNWQANTDCFARSASDFDAIGHLSTLKGWKSISEPFWAVTSALATQFFVTSSGRQATNPRGGCCDVKHKRIGEIEVDKRSSFSDLHGKQLVRPVRPLINTL